MVKAHFSPFNDALEALLNSLLTINTREEVKCYYNTLCDNFGFSEYFNTFIHCARVSVYIPLSSITAVIILPPRI